jgi:hypothetical protein
MTLYDDAARGWRPEEGAPVMDRHPLAVLGVIALPLLALVVYGVAVS